ncbi:hypothetical protein [Hymenobacter jeollabukensis]|uniref:Uncharacterized protein n=1 Tax=Hymenobacter jeollabukensis TaxID=2025313 RepID=A0A5R8WSK3_9BACT|nr:hypothetical protein [Hymenobacter jeollabukensis]TLM93351.1 hypothetical protein FDY95_12110 [Hymenobacter jeollabukensis]
MPIRPRFLLPLLLLLLTALSVSAATPTLLLDVARFRPLAAGNSYEVELYVTVPGNGLTYIKRTRDTYQAGATVALQVLGADGRAVHSETITLKPPVISDTTIGIKNPQSFLRRLTLRGGQYTIKAELKDMYRKTAGTFKVEEPLALDMSATAPVLSDIVFLAKAAGKTTEQNNFTRGGYSLVRTPAGNYGRGADQLYFYLELYNAPAGQPLTLHYHVESAEGFAADADAPLGQAKAGRPTTVAGELPLGGLSQLGVETDGTYALTVEVRSGKKVLASRKGQFVRTRQEYAPAGASLPR